MPEQPISTPTRYDGLLAALPVSVAGGAIAGWWSTLSTTVGIGMGGVVATALLVVSLFVVPPE
ncbi:MAG: hypothetical protein V5A36_04085 [Natronomonas sp.]